MLYEENNTTPDSPGVAYGVHVVMLEDGNFGIQATGTPSLGEMYMILARACKSVEARMAAETVAQLMEHQRTQTRIITPR